MSLRVIKGSRRDTGPRAGRRRSLAEDEQIVCGECANDIGVETSSVVEVVLAPRRSPDGKLSGGTKAYACAHCLARGKITTLIIE